MSLWLAIAAKPPELGKSRLAGVLDPDRRARLCRDMVDHVISVAVRVVPPRRCLLVTASPELQALAGRHDVTALADRGDGLNAAFALATRHVVRQGATALLTLGADLPLLAPDDLRAMLATDGDVVIAPDRHGAGTNGLLMRPPGRIAYRHGTHSLERHRAAAQGAGARVVPIVRDGLACDLDLPEDLPPFFGKFNRRGEGCSMSAVPSEREAAHD